MWDRLSVCMNLKVDTCGAAWRLGWHGMLDIVNGLRCTSLLLWYWTRAVTSSSVLIVIWTVLPKTLNMKVIDNLVGFPWHLELSWSEFGCKGCVHSTKLYQNCPDLPFSFDFGTASAIGFVNIRHRVHVLHHQPYKISKYKISLNNNNYHVP